MQKSLSRWWLIIGVSALAIAGLLSLVLVAGRSPGMASPLLQALFHKTLVVHVDLSVLVWFLSIACLMWSLLAAGSRPIIAGLEQAALIAFALGALLLALSLLDGRGEALMSNYIPVITSPIFFLGLGLLTSGIGLMLVRLFTARREGEFDNPQRFGLTSAGVIAAMAGIAFYWSYRQIPHGRAPSEYYDLLFWGGGHVLQFVHVQIVMVCWLLLAKALKPQFHVYPPHLFLLFSIGLLACAAVPYAYLFAADEGAQRQFFTYLMILAGGIAPTILALWILPGLITFTHLRKGETRALYSALCSSILLFIYGNILGGLIQGQNVVIPAHYHGSIVGITLAFMGVAYLLLPRFGWANVSGWRLAYWQPIIYALGQFLHISGLAWSGGYGVLRKTPGGLEGLEPSVKAAMGLMGIGGLLAIIGGFLFVYIVARAAWKQA